MAFFQRGSNATKAKRYHTPQCGACGLHAKCIHPKLPVQGSGKRGILLVAGSPTESDDAKGAFFTGTSGTLVRESLEDVSIDITDDCWSTGALICRSGTPTDRQIAYCAPNVQRAIRELNPRVIVLFGQSALQSVLPPLYGDSAGSIAQWQGYVIPDRKLNAWIVPTYCPKTITAEDKRGMELQFARTIDRVSQLTPRPYNNYTDEDKRNPLRNELRGVQYLYDAADVVHALQEFEEDNKPICFDYETDRLKPDNSDSAIHTCAISNGKRTIAFPWQPGIESAMRELLRCPLPKWGCNIKFEERWTRAKLGMGVKNWDHDTMIGARVIHGKTRVASIKFQAYAQLGVARYDGEIEHYLKSNGTSDNSVNRIKQAPMGALLRYNALDAILEHKVARIQKRELNEQI